MHTGCRQRRAPDGSRLWLVGLACVLSSVGCFSVITGDNATLDRFAEFERTGGTCAATDVGSVDLSAATQFRWLVWQQELGELRAESGNVYYERLQDDAELSAMLDHAVAQIAELEPKTLANKEARLAFWLNAYNLLTLHAASTAWRTDSSFRVDNNDFAFFQQAVHRVAKRTFSLNQIENGVLRGDRLHPSTFYLTDEEFRPIQEFHDEIWGSNAIDPRIHFVLNCASSSCPVLTKVPLQGSDLDETLETATLDFLSDEEKGAGPEGMSQIFDFYAMDFDDAGGIEAFISKYRDLDEIDTGRFLPYDWSLNLEETSK